MPFTTEISGVGSAQFTGSDYTNPVLVQAFVTALSKFYELKTGSGSITAAELYDIQSNVNFLIEIAKNGVSVNLNSANFQNPSVNGSDPGTSPNVIYFLTPAMIEVLNRLFKSLAPGGNLDSLTTADLLAFRNKTTTENIADIQNIFVYAARLLTVVPPLNPGDTPSAISTDPTEAAAQVARVFATGRVFTSDTINESVTRSLQAFTEMEYVNTANQVINEKLVDLKNALKATQSSLDNLNQLQQLHNNIIVNSRSFTLNLGSSGPSTTLDNYITKYEKYASAQLKQALVPQLTSEVLPFSLPPSEYVLSVYPTSGNTSTNYSWTFKITLVDPSKYYAFNTSTNTFLSTVPTSFILSGYYVSSTGPNPQSLTIEQIKTIVGDGYNGVQKFPLLGTLSAMDTLKLQMTRQRGALSALLVSLASTTPASVLADPLKRSQALIGQISAVYGDLVNNLGSTLSTTPTVAAKIGIRS